MTIRPILRAGHPVLRLTAAPVTDSDVSEIALLVEDMYDSMCDAGGAGIAAPQIGVSLRVVIFEIPAYRLDEGEDAIPLQVLINPTIEPLGDEVALGWEGCLSLPGMRGEVPRPARIRYTGLDLDGQLIDRTVEGFHALVVQHEVDHLDGILYPGRMTDMSRFGFTQELVEGGICTLPVPPSDDDEEQEDD